MADRRGRPKTYSAKDRHLFAELIRRHGARRTRELSGGAISVMTLLQIAREFGIPLKKGRRSRAS